VSLGPGCPRHKEAANKACYDARCQRTWKVEGAPTADEQLRMWIAGKSVCPNENRECCPDFSCCKPEYLWPEAMRRKFGAVGQGEREKMLMQGLGMALSSEGINAYVTRGDPTDRE
jgi:hypothetical protein